MWTLMKTDEAAEYLTNTLGVPIRANTLKRKRVVGGGPVFHRLGARAFYTPDDLAAWAKDAPRPLTSTSAEPTPRARAPAAA